MCVLTSGKTIRSFLLGLAGFFGAFFSFSVNLPPLSITIMWSYSLPLLASMAYGEKCGLIAGILGLGAFFPFALWPTNGWANVVTIILYSLLFFWFGYFASIRQRRPSPWNHPLVIVWPFILFYFFATLILYPIALSFNPPFWEPATIKSVPMDVLLAATTKGVLLMCLIIFFNVCMLKIPLVRYILGLTVSRESRLNGRIFVAAILGVIGLWCIQVIFYCIFIGVNFPKGLFQIADPHEIIELIIFAIAGLFIGYIASLTMEIRLLARRDLEAMNETLELRVAERTVELTAAHQEMTAQYEELEQKQAMLYRSAKIQTILREFAEAVSLSSSMDEFYRKVHCLLGQVLPAKFFLVNLLDEVTGEITVPFHSEEVYFVPRRRPSGKGMTEYVMRLGQTVLLQAADIARLREQKQYTLEQEQKVEVRQYLGAPLKNSQGKPFGMISLVLLDDEQTFQPEDAETFSIIAAQISLAIERKKSEDQLRRGAEIQTILREIAEAAILAPSMDELYATVHRLVGRVLPAKLFHINIVDEEHGEIVVPFKADDANFIPERRPMDKGMTEYIIGLGRPANVSPSDQKRLSDRGEYTLGNVQNVQSRHYLGAPLIDARGKAFGVMALIQMGENQAFLPEDVEVLSIVAAQVAMAIERKRSEGELRDSEQRYRTIMHGSSDAIALVDPETKKIIEANERWLQIRGYTAEEVGGMTIYDIADQSQEEIDKEYRDILSAGGISSSIRRVRCKDGRNIEVEWSAAVVNFVGRPTLLFSLRDLSLQRKMQEQTLKEVALAAEVQRMLVPTDFDDLLVSVKAIYFPKQLVSGDFYDYAWSADHQRLSGFVLDISGHGVASSLQGIAVSTYFKDVMDSPMGLDAKLKWINQRVLRYFTDDTFAAALLFEFDFSRQLLRFATAGIYGFLCSSSTLPTVVRQAGSLVGITEAAEYTEFSLPIKTGDTFYFMSDGIFDQLETLENLNPANFEQTVIALRDLSLDRTIRDDCSAVCVLIKEWTSFPVAFEIHRYGDYPRIRVRMRDLLQRIAAIDAGRVMVAIGEALNNAARESMDVRVKVNQFGRLLIVRIRDGGRGFDGNGRVASLLAGNAGDKFEERLYAEGGRGILIMVSWMDKVIYNRKGNEVMLVKRLAKQ